VSASSAWAAEWRNLADGHAVFSWLVCFQRPISETGAEGYFVSRLAEKAVESRKIVGTISWH
jgi:hypothetical protein